MTPLREMGEYLAFFMYNWVVLSSKTVWRQGFHHGLNTNFGHEYVFLSVTWIEGTGLEGRVKSRGGVDT